MNQSLKTQKRYFSLASIIAPKYAGFKASQLIQQVGVKTIRKREKSFYANAKHFIVPFRPENLNCYELGNPEGELVFMVHGWESNAGSLSFIANQLAEKGFRVILLDFPAHAYSELNQTNILICKNAFLALVNYIEPYQPFSVVAHSLGALVVAYALANSPYKTNRIVFVACVNKFMQLFENFKSHVSLGNSAYKHLLSIMENISGDTLDKISIEYMGKLIKYNKMLLVHDKNDCVEPLKNSKAVYKSLFDTSILEVEKTGHLLILWHKETASKITSFIQDGVQRKVDDIIPMYENLNDFEGISSQSNNKKAYANK